MERNISKTKIIEFNGSCGSGKSTLALKIGLALRDEKIRCLTLADVMNYQVSKWKTIYIMLEKKRIFRICRYVYSLKPFRNRTEYMRNLIHLYCVLYELSKENTLNTIILEEGILQWISAIAFEDKIRNRKVVTKLMDVLFDLDIIIVNCNLNYSENLKRIKKRNRMHGRIDRSIIRNSNESSLQVQRKNLKNIRSCIAVNNQCIELDMQESEISNIDKVMQII